MYQYRNNYNPKIWGNENKKQFNNSVDNTDIQGNYLDPLYVYQPIRRKGNDVYFYSEVDRNSQLVLMSLLNDIKLEIMQINVENDNHYNTPIRLHINSYGGELSAGLALYDFISNLNVETIGIVEGVAASAASLILLACTHREMTDNSSILIHQLSGGMEGSYTEMCDWQGNADKSMSKLEYIYLTETNIGITPEMNEKMEKLLKDEKQEEFEEYYSSIYESRLNTLVSILKHDIEWTKEECENLGLVDKQQETVDIELTEEDQEEISKYVQKVVNRRMKNTTQENKQKSTKKKKSNTKKSKE